MLTDHYDINRIMQTFQTLCDTEMITISGGDQCRCERFNDIVNKVKQKGNKKRKRERNAYLEEKEEKQEEEVIVKEKKKNAKAQILSNRTEKSTSRFDQ